ncbi:MAG: tRNA glutamyl-Q(34) synthetase GluQRS [Neomegalonema sp.]|nr:tRNA glutamyl-Q(34) synthetase GluQRS [Neomegalonema sp.]
MVERFAPSPNGRLHLGHAYSALLAWRHTRAAGGRFLLRLEDLDLARTRQEHIDAIEADLTWLGIDWERPVLRQSERFDAYGEALESLQARGLLYPCFCTRGDIQGALSAPQEGAPLLGPDGVVYPGTCRALSANERRMREAGGTSAVLRLDMRKAIASLGGNGVVSKLSWKELGASPTGRSGRIELDPQHLIEACGDIVLSRRDFPTSYHLAVVVDDAFQGVTHVTRGEDLFEATPIHRLLQALLGRPVPAYRHHALIRNAAGKRLAKRDRDAGIAELRQAGLSPQDVIALLPPLPPLLAT